MFDMAVARREGATFNYAQSIRVSAFFVSNPMRATYDSDQTRRGPRGGFVADTRRASNGRFMKVGT